MQALPPRGVYPSRLLHIEIMTRRKYLLGAILLTSLTAGCGKYGKPLPPEKVSPRAVAYTEVRGTSQGVSFGWLAPTDDARGKPLKSLNGYRIYRKQIKKPSDQTDPSVPFELIATLPDSTLASLQLKKEEAQRELKPTRRVKLSDQERTITFLDPHVEQGATYLYKVVAFNRRSIDGDFRNFVKVVFLGEGSQIASLENDEIDPGLQEDNVDLGAEETDGF